MLPMRKQIFYSKAPKFTAIVALPRFYIAYIVWFSRVKEKQRQPELRWTDEIVTLTKESTYSCYFDQF